MSSADPTMTVASTTASSLACGGVFASPGIRPGNRTWGMLKVLRGPSFWDKVVCLTAMMIWYFQNDSYVPVRTF